MESLEKVNVKIEHSFNHETIQLIKNTVSPPNLTDKEFEMFIYQAKRTGLDPLSRQIYCIKSKDKVSIQATIDGLRLIAERTGLYSGQTPVMWCGVDGQWVDVWLSNINPSAAKVGVYRKDFNQPLYAIARWDTYAQKTFDGKSKYTWSKMPDLMLGKCAEALALRKAFPQELSNIYSSEEMEAINSSQEMHHSIVDKFVPVSEINFSEKVIAYLNTCKTKSDLEFAYETAKTRDSYINSTDKDKQDIDKAYVDAIANFVTPVKEMNEKFNPETESPIPFDIPVKESSKEKEVITTFDLIPNELPEITKMKECKTMTALNKYYKSITETPYYKQYAEDYKAELQQTYNARIKELGK